MRLLAALLMMMGASAATAPPQRIVSTAPSITEMLYALGLGDRVVAVSSYCNFPREAQSKPRIGSFLNPNLEMIASLRPDLVLCGKGQLRGARWPGGMKWKVVELEHDTLPGIFESIRTMGETAGVPGRGAQLTRELEDGLNAVRRSVAGRKPARVVFIVGRTPGRLEGLVAVGKSSYLNAVMEVAGGINIFRDSITPYPKVNLEEIIARDPEVIIDMGDMAQPEKITPQQQQAVRDLWKHLPMLSAVKSARVHPVTSDIFVVPGPRVVEAARRFAELLHPERKPR